MSQTARADRAVEAALPAVAPSGPQQLPETLHALLLSACQAAGLLTLELEVTGCPGLATTVRRPAQVPELVVWASHVAASRWHGGVALLASAPDAGPERRVVVEHAARTISELVAAELRATQAETLAQRALELAGVDALTQVGNRRTWERALDDEARRARRYRTPTAVCVLDLDGLKRINDEHGHAAGDAYLRRAAQAVRAVARSVDVICRLGGDEFGLLAPQTDADGAHRLAARLREALDVGAVSASVGVATAEDGGLDEAWQAADADMYGDKRARSGR
ncbi:MAG: histidine kinase [Frankiales bacterium]|jgi:diguanylate cyclase (GGDEF)-like protein|nr:histidine kinase [Frankiales bacterium]